jgi:hypothetical protein
MRFHHHYRFAHGTSAKERRRWAKFRSSDQSTNRRRGFIVVDGLGVSRTPESITVIAVGNRKRFQNELLGADSHKFAKTMGHLKQSSDNPEKTHWDLRRRPPKG